MKAKMGDYEFPTTLSVRKETTNKVFETETQYLFIVNSPRVEVVDPVSREVRYYEGQELPLTPSELAKACLAALGKPPTSNWDVSPVPTPVANLLEFQREVKAMGGQTPVSSMRDIKASGLPERQSLEFFGPSTLKNALPAWQLRETLLKMHGAVYGHFNCADLGDPKLNPPDDDVATPVIVEAGPPR